MEKKQGEICVKFRDNTSLEKVTYWKLKDLNTMLIQNICKFSYFFLLQIFSFLLTYRINNCTCECMPYLYILGIYNICSINYVTYKTVLHVAPVNIKYLINRRITSEKD